MKRENAIELKALGNSRETDATETTEQNFIARLPVELLQKEIGQHLSLKDKGRLVCTAKVFGPLFQSDLNEVKAKEAATLVLHATKAEFEQVKTIIQKNPHLLLETAEVEDYSGRKRKRTAFRAALAAFDVSIKPQEKEMAEWLAEQLDQHYPGEKEKQYQEQFPPEWEDEKQERHKRGINALDQVVNAIRQAPNYDTFEAMRDHCESALQDFREYLVEEYIQQIHTPDALKNAGTDFDEELLVEAFKLYNQHYDALGGFNQPKTNLLWRQVICYLQRFVSARTAQDFCQGLSALSEDVAAPRRQLTFHYGYNGAFFPVDLVSAFRLGYEWAALGRCD